MRVARLIVLFVVLSSGAARAENGSFGLGLILGQPTGVTGAYQISDHTAIDAAVGLGWIDDRNFYLHVEFDYFLPTLITGNSVDLSAYLGIGGFFVSHADPAFGARAPFGLSLDFKTVPLQIFGEASLLLLLTPDTDLDVRGAIGFRYYF
ncbi:MAG TPA: hypothetical protein VIV40_25490 [Kofleriaceae bacterium]